MADDVNIVFNIAEKGFAQVQKNVAELSAKLEALGVDMKTVQANLSGIESAGRKFSSTMSSQATSTDKAAKATEKLAKAQREYKRDDNRRASNAGDQEFDSLTRATGASQKLAQAQDGLASPSLRYALYDVANAYKIMGAAMAGASIYAVAVGAQFESAFTNVERTLQTGTTSAEVDAIRDSLVQLSGQIPLTFQELSSIATIGNQMGIAKEDVVDFTGTIARFSSVAGISIDETTKAFGGFMAQTGLAPKYLENLGASIAKVGIDSNATEAQILSLMREITAGAVGAGFAADEIVGLSGTLASLQIAPERARGSLTTYFSTLNKAVAGGGEDLQNFATIVGVTAEELDRMVRSGEGGDVLRGFLEGISDLDNVATTQALDELGLAQLRVSDTFRRLSGDLGIYDRDQENANQAFMEGAELQRQYAMTMDDLASQWTIFINGINGLIEAVTGGAVPTLAALFGVINKVIFGLTEWLGNNKWLAAALAFGTAVIGIGGALILVRGLMTAATAAMIGARYVIRQMGGTAIAAMGPMKAFAKTMIGVGSGARAGAGGVLTLRSAALLLLASTGIGLLVTILGSMAGSVLDAGDAAGNAALSLAEYKDAMESMSDEGEETIDTVDGFSNSTDKAGNSATQAAKKIRLLTDYVSDLQGVFNRSTDLRFGSQAAMDDITLKWIELNEEALEYQRTIRTLTADKSLKQYWLGIAEMYDDQIRASQLREEIAQIDDDLAEAQRGASTELEGNSQAAIENRKTMRDLLGSYEDYVLALTAAGASQEQIQQVISQLNGDFSAQAQALGFNGGELVTYGDRFRDLTTIVAQMPRDITIGFNADPAIQAMDEFFAKAEESARLAGEGSQDAFGDGFGGGGGGGGDDPFEEFYDGGVNKAPDYGKSAGQLWIESLGRWITGNGSWDTVIANWEGVLDEFENVINPAIENFLSDVRQNIIDFFTDVIGEVGNFFTDIGQGTETMVTEVGNFLGDAGGIVASWFGAEAEDINARAPGDGRNAGKGIKDGLGSELTSGTNPIFDFMNNANNKAWSNGSSIGSNLGGGITSALQSALDAGKTAVSIMTGGAVKMWANGGYTGAGGKYEPAGIVHRGEYVVPKKHVNQATGLPDMRYLASLQGAKSAPRSSYASGGYVNPGNGGPIELGPASLGAIISGMNVRLNVGQRELARATSGGDKSLAWSGSN